MGFNSGFKGLNFSENASCEVLITFQIN